MEITTQILECYDRTSIELSDETRKELTKEIKKFVDENPNSFYYIKSDEIYDDGGDFGERIEIGFRKYVADISEEKVEEEVGLIIEFIEELGIKVTTYDIVTYFAWPDPENEGYDECMQVELVFSQ